MQRYRINLASLCLAVFKQFWLKQAKNGEEIREILVRLRGCCVQDKEGHLYVAGTKSFVLTCLIRFAMKTFLQLLKITVICLLLAGWMRMCYRPVSSVTWTDLFNQSVERWWSGLWLMPVTEAVHYYWGYLLALASFVLLAKLFLKDKTRRRTFVKLGLLHGLGGYLLVHAFTPSAPPLKDGYFLLVMYSLIGSLFGYLYHQWVARPERKAHKQHKESTLLTTVPSS